MHKVKTMIDPPNCLICGRGNTVDHPMEEEEFWAIDTERDINWGDSAYICFACCERIAEFAGYAPVEQVEEKERVITKQLKKIHDLESKLEIKHRRLEQITTGLEVRKKVIAEGKRSKKKVASKS